MKKSGKCPEPSSGSFSRMASPGPQRLDRMRGQRVAHRDRHRAHVARASTAPARPCGPAGRRRRPRSPGPRAPARSTRSCARSCRSRPRSTAARPRSTPSVIGSIRLMRGTRSPTIRFAYSSTVAVAPGRQHRRRLALLDDRRAGELRAGGERVAIVDRRSRCSRRPRESTRAAGPCAPVAERAARPWPARRAARRRSPRAST